MRGTSARHPTLHVASVACYGLRHVLVRATPVLVFWCVVEQVWFGAYVSHLVSCYVGPFASDATMALVDKVRKSHLTGHLKKLSLPRHATQEDCDAGSALHRTGVFQDARTQELVAPMQCQTRNTNVKDALSWDAESTAKRLFQVVCTSKGFVVDAFEFMGSGSWHVSKPWIRISTYALVMISATCRRFAANSPCRSPLADSPRYPFVIHVIHRFHTRYHVELGAWANVHPDTTEHGRQVDGINTSACEMLFV